MSNSQKSLAELAPIATADATSAPSLPGTLIRDQAPPAERSTSVTPGPLQTDQASLAESAVRSPDTLPVAGPIVWTARQPGAAAPLT